MLFPFIVLSADKRSSNEKTSLFAAPPHSTIPWDNNWALPFSTPTSPIPTQFLPLHSKVYAKPTAKLFLCGELMLLYLSRMINGMFRPIPLFAMEGIRAQQRFPAPPSISSRWWSSFTYANYINGQSLQQGSQKQEPCSYSFKYALSSRSSRIICIIIAEIWN